MSTQNPQSDRTPHDHGAGEWLPSRERALSSAFVDLADTPEATNPVDDVLQRLVVHCADLLPVSAAALHGSTHTVRLSAASDQRVHRVHADHDSVRDGPGRECLRTGEAINVAHPDLYTHQWPEGIGELHRQGFDGLDALPLRWDGEVLGALTLCTADRSRLTTDDLHLAQDLGRSATVSILRFQAQRRSEIRADQLQEALDSRVIIEQAKGVLIGREGIPATEAFTRLRRQARQQRVPLKKLAHDTITRAEGTGQPERDRDHDIEK
jgi:transcriptional regulator with GAF, ATPase, and Fis domain